MADLRSMKRRRRSLTQSLADTLCMRLKKHGTQPASDLAKAIGRCRVEDPCWLLACPMCQDEAQQQLATAVVKVWKHDLPTTSITMIPKDGFIQYDGLDGFDFDNFSRRHTTATKRVLENGQVAMVVVELSLNTFNNSNPYWQAHLHVTLEGVLSRDAERHIRRRYSHAPDLGIYQPVMVVEVEPSDLWTVTQYPLKTVMRRSTFIAQPKPERKRKPHRATASEPLTSHQAVTLALSQAKYNVTAPVNLIGLKRARDADGISFRLKRIQAKSKC